MKLWVIGKIWLGEEQKLHFTEICLATFQWNCKISKGVVAIMHQETW